MWPPERPVAAPGSLDGPQLGRAPACCRPPAASEALVRGSIACYPPVWGTNDPAGPVQGAARDASLRTVLCTEAVATCLGASALFYGDVSAVLCDPYYPKHERLSAAEAATVLAWHRFALRCRDLF